MAARWRSALWIVAVVSLIAFAFWPSQGDGKSVQNRRIVRFWHMWSGEWKDVVDKIVDRYNDSQDTYFVEALSVPGGSNEKFLLAAVGGDPPDVMAQWNPVIPTWADSRLIQPLDELMSPAELQRFRDQAYPVVQKLGLYKDRLYGIAVGMNMFACYYLPEHFRQAGLDPERFPQTLEELVQVGEKLHRFDEQKRLARIGFLPRGWAAYAPYFNGGFFDWDREEVTIDTEANRMTLAFLVESRQKLGFDQVVRFESGIETGSFSGGWPFIGGAYSIVYDGQWRVEQLRKFAPDLEYMTAPLPAPKGGKPGACLSNGNFMIVPRNAKQKEGAMDFIKFWSGLSDPETAAEFYTWGGWLPLTPEVAEAPAYRRYLEQNPQFRTFVDLMPSENVVVNPPVPYQLYLMDRVGRAEDLAIRGSLSIDEAAKTVLNEVQQEVQRRKELGYDR